MTVYRILGAKKADQSSANEQIDNIAMGFIKNVDKKLKEAEKEVQLAKMEGYIKSYAK